MGLIYDTQEEAAAAAEQLSALGTSAIKLLREVVEHQQVQKSKPSDAARKLEDAGFIRITEVDPVWGKEVVLHSCLQGEEALEALEKNS